MARLEAVIEILRQRFGASLVDATEDDEEMADKIVALFGMASPGHDTWDESTLDIDETEPDTGLGEPSDTGFESPWLEMDDSSDEEADEEEEDEDEHEQEDSSADKVWFTIIIIITF